jgi:hypothetical protein
MDIQENQVGLQAVDLFDGFETVGRLRYDFHVREFGQYFLQAFA